MTDRPAFCRMYTHIIPSMALRQKIQRVKEAQKSVPSPTSDLLHHRSRSRLQGRWAEVSLSGYGPPHGSRLLALAGDVEIGLLKELVEVGWAKGKLFEHRIPLPQSLHLNPTNNVSECPSVCELSGAFFSLPFTFPLTTALLMTWTSCER